MNISELFNKKNVVYSLEVFPPKTDTSVNMIYNTLSGLKALPADFISVTYGAGGSAAQRDKTCEISSLIRSEYNIEPVAHLTCIGSQEDEIASILHRLKDECVENIMALRGDIPAGAQVSEKFKHASDLAKFIKEYDDSFNLIGACYPEGHYESDSFKCDIENLKIKISCGVSHLISQLFFDNSAFYSFLEKARSTNITVPIEAGIMPITTRRQIERTVALSGASLPNEFSTMINKYAESPEDLKKAGLDYAIRQIIDLIEQGVQGIHLYTMNHVDTAVIVSGSIGELIAAKNGSVY